MDKDSRFSRLRQLGLALALGIGAVAVATPAHAVDLSQIGVGVSYSVPSGNQFAGLGTSTGLFTEALGDGFELLGPGFRLHSTFTYQRYALKNSSTSYNLVALALGITAQQPIGKSPKKGRGGSSTPVISPFFSVLVGGAVDWLHLSGANSQINASLGGSIQAIPGFEFPIYSDVTGCISLPFQHYAMGKQLSVWNALFHVRYAL